MRPANHVVQVNEGIIDANDFDASINSWAHHQATNAAKSVDPNSEFLSHLDGYAVQGMKDLKPTDLKQNCSVSFMLLSCLMPRVSAKSTKITYIHTH